MPARPSGSGHGASAGRPTAAPRGWPGRGRGMCGPSRPLLAPPGGPQGALRGSGGRRNGPGPRACQARQCRRGRPPACSGGARRRGVICAKPGPWTGRRVGHRIVIHCHTGGGRRRRGHGRPPRAGSGVRGPGPFRRAAAARITVYDNPPAHAPPGRPSAWRLPGRLLSRPSGGLGPWRQGPCRRPSARGPRVGTAPLPSP